MAGGDDNEPKKRSGKPKRLLPGGQDIRLTTRVSHVWALYLAIHNSCCRKYLLLQVMKNELLNIRS